MTEFTFRVILSIDADMLCKMCHAALYRHVVMSYLHKAASVSALMFL